MDGPRTGHSDRGPRRKRGDRAGGLSDNAGSQHLQRHQNSTPYPWDGGQEGGAGEKSSLPPLPVKDRVRTYLDASLGPAISHLNNDSNNNDNDALQVLPGTILSIQDDCMRMPTVELNEVISGNSAADAVLQDDQGTLGNLELDGSGNGSVFVFTDPTNLATLQVVVFTYKSSL